jgi:hypothetical protein
MVEFTKSLLSFSWAQSLFGAQQLMNTLTVPPPGRRTGKATAAFTSVAWATGDHLGDFLKGAYHIGDMLQQGAVDAAVNFVTRDALNPNAMLRSTAGFLRQALDFLRFLAAGQDLRLAWREFTDKLQVFQWVRNVEALLHLPADGSYVPLTELVDRAYALDPFPALWAVEGAGHYYAVSLWGPEEDPRDLLTDSRAAAAPDKTMTMLHAGIGLGFAERLLEKANPETPAPEIRAILQRFLTLCHANSRPGYVGAALESLGLVARVFHPQQLVPVIDRELNPLDEEALAYFWHGVGRAIYFSPTYFLPFAGSPWRAVEMCRGEAPHMLAHLNALAGLAWAVTLVNMRQPQIMEMVLKQHGDDFADTDAFADGVRSSIIMRYDTTPDEPFITAFYEHQANPADSSLVRTWDRQVKRPCWEALHFLYPRLKQQRQLGEVFHFRALTERPPDQFCTGPPNADPFRILLQRIDDHKDLFLSWRRDFASCSDALSATIAHTFNTYHSHGNVPKPVVDPDDVRVAIRQAFQKPFDRTSLDQFAGSARGWHHRYSIATGAELGVTTVYTVWGKPLQAKGAYIQKVTASGAGYTSTTSPPNPSQNKVDLIVNLYRDDLGITSWAKLYRQGGTESGFICYTLNNYQVLWISKVLTGGTAAAEDNVFLLSLEWWTEHSAVDRHYSIVAMSFAFDFPDCKARIIGDTVSEIHYLGHEPSTNTGLPRQAEEEGEHDLSSYSFPLRPDPLEDMIKHLETQRDRFNSWRTAFRRCGGPMSDAITNFFAVHRHTGSFPTADVSVAEIRAAFDQGIQSGHPFQQEDFDRTAGVWKGTFGDYDVATGEEMSVITNYSLWHRAVGAHGGCVQKVIGSESVVLYKEDLPDLSKNQLDIFVNFFREDLGITGWASLYQHGRRVQPVVGYRLADGKLLWISQVLTEELEPLPGQEKVFFVSLEWVGYVGEASHFCLVLFLLEIDFAECGAKVYGDRFRKGRYERWRHGPISGGD